MMLLKLDPNWIYNVNWGITDIQDIGSSTIASL